MSSLSYALVFSFVVVALSQDRTSSQGSGQAQPQTQNQGSSEPPSQPNNEPPAYVYPTLPWGYSPPDSPTPTPLSDIPTFPPIPGMALHQIDVDKVPFHLWSSVFLGRLSPSSRNKRDIPSMPSGVPQISPQPPRLPKPPKYPVPSKADGQVATSVSEFIGMIFPFLG